MTGSGCWLLREKANSTQLLPISQTGFQFSGGSDILADYSITINSGSGLMKQLSHLDDQGRANMVDVTEKEVTSRRAVAEAIVNMQPETFNLIIEGRHSKGDVMAVARIAGIQAAKQTSNLIPLCHPLSLSSVKVELTPDHDRHCIRIQVACRLAGRTGVEMEALTGASVAALTLYDMCKAVDKGMVIERIRLLEKEGGKSGHWTAETNDSPNSDSPQKQANS